MADSVLDAYASRARTAPFTEHDMPSAWSDTFAAGLAFQRREENSNSASNAWEKKNAERARKIKELGGDENLALTYATEPFAVHELRRLEGEGRGPGDPEVDYWRSSLPFAAKAYDHVRSFEERYPDQVPDDRELGEQIRTEFAQLRARDQDTLNRGSGFAAFAGQALGTLTDPLVLATAPIGIEAGVGKTALGTIGRTALAEGAVGAVTEIPIQAQVAAFKRDIESPWSFADSAVNVLAAGVGGGVLGGGIAAGRVGYKKALEKYRAWKGKPGAAPTPEMDAAEDALEQAVSAHDQNPLPQPPGAEDVVAELHARALDTAQAQVDAGAPVDVSKVVGGLEARDPVGDISTRAEDPTALVDVDPLTLHVDAKTFQFKGGGDAEGVTSSLRDVERFDRRLAGVALIWERADGRMFIADGHQRVALARRAIAAGQDAAEVRLNGFLLREADGVTAVDARRMAAVKNMAEGSGSALDAAKILRDVGPVGEALLPPLPPRSALVKQARGLAALGDDEFMQVINGAVEPNVGALVGAATSDPKLQGAMIQVLKRAQPANEIQARGIIEQVKAAGLETRTTEDLFGEQSFSESLYLERAQVLDAALKLAREDRVIFGGLVRNEDRIAGAGSNQLDRSANLARSQEAADAATQITVRANNKGALSDALSDAARRVREGAKPGTVAKAFLEAARREILQGDRGGRAPGKTRPDGDAKGPAREGLTEPKLGAPIRAQEIPAPQQQAVWQQFSAKQSGQTLDDLYAVAEMHQRALIAAAQEIADELGDAVKLIDPGVKARAGSEAKIAQRAYKDAGELSDVIRAGFITRSPELAAMVVERLAAKFETLDYGVTVTGMGYLDHKALVRFSDGRVGELQFWDEALAAAKFGEGHTLYQATRGMTVEEAATPEGLAKREQITEASKLLYAGALARATPEWRQIAMMALPEDMRLRVQAALETGGGSGAGNGGKPGNISSQAARDSSVPDSKTATGTTRDQAAAPELSTKASSPPAGEGRTTAARDSQLKNRSAIDSPPRSIIRQVDDPTSAQPTNSRTGTVEDGDYDGVMSQYQDLLDDHGQLLTVTQSVDGVVTERPASGVIDELDTLEESLERVRLCSLPARAA